LAALEEKENENQLLKTRMVELEDKHQDCKKAIHFAQITSIPVQQ
jgi:hypothetical protein